MCSLPASRSDREIAERVATILETRKLSLHQASQRSAALFGGSSRYYLPHNLYHDLRRRSFTPSRFQLFALSRITNYRLTDWFRIFGIDLAAIPALQIQFSQGRTILLDASLDDSQSMIPWVRNLRHTPHPGAVVPLSRLLEWGSPRRLSSLSQFKDNGFVYARIGEDD